MAKGIDSLTPEELESEILDLENDLALNDLRDAARSNFYNFIRLVRPSFKFSWYHEALCQILDDVVHGRRKRVMISMPPRHSKSELASRLFPAYYFAVHPDRSLIATSYSADLSSAMNRDVQNIIDSPEYSMYVPHVRLPDENIRTVAQKRLRNSDLFELALSLGRYRSAGVGGGITGMGGHGLITDDPYRNQEDANSPVYRAKVINWYKSTFRTRLIGDGFILIIMTRWHTEDLIGYLLTEQANNPDADQWDVFNLPAIKDTEDQSLWDTREIGEPLWEEGGFGLEFLRKAQASLGPALWVSLYQQRPTILGGGKLKTYNFRFWYHEGTEPPPFHMPGPDGKLIAISQKALPATLRQHMSSWDFAFKAGKKNDFIAGTVWGYDAPECPAESFLLDLHHERAAVVASCDGLRGVHKRWPQVRQHLIEDKANGPAVEDLLKQTIPGIFLVDPKGGKEVRADAASVNIDAHNIYLPHPSVHPWVHKVLAECSAFPKGVNDDIVDSITQFINYRYGRPQWRVLG